MKFFICSLLIALFAAGTVSAQDYKITRYEKEPNYLAFRFGTWFPKDEEKGLKFENISYENAKSEIDQSQAIGLDLQYQNLIAFPLYMDFSLGGWYTTYTFKYTELLADPAAAQKADSWSAVVPVTLGLDFHPLPKNPLQPYVMAGAGAYFAFSGRTLIRYSNNQIDEDKNDVAFGWFIGAGFDFFFSPGLGASLAARYNHIKYDEPLLTGQQDLSGMTISLGIAVARATID